jgi:hypothetical protein
MAYLTVSSIYITLSCWESLRVNSRVVNLPNGGRSVTCSKLYKGASGFWNQEPHRPPTTATNSTTSSTATLVDVKALSVQHPSSSEAARGAHQAPRRRLLSGWVSNLTFDLKDLIPSAWKLGLVDDDNLFEWEILIIGYDLHSSHTHALTHRLSQPRPPDTL